MAPRWRQQRRLVPHSTAGVNKSSFSVTEAWSHEGQRIATSATAALSTAWRPLRPLGGGRVCERVRQREPQGQARRV